MKRQRLGAEHILHELSQATIIQTGQEHCCETGGAAAQQDRQDLSPLATVHGGLKVDQSKQMSELESEYAGLKRIVASHAIDMAITNEVASGEPLNPPRRWSAVEYCIDHSHAL